MATPLKSRPAPADRSRSGDGEPGRGEDHIGYLLKRLQHSIRQAIDERMRRAGVGLSFAHISALFVISHHPGIPGARIARATMVTAQTMNTILRRLERDGSVARRPHPENRRADCWYVTDVGRAQMQLAKVTADPVWDALLAPLTADEVMRLRDLLRRCIDGLEQSRTGAPDGCCAAGPMPADRPRRRAAARELPARQPVRRSGNAP